MTTRADLPNFDPEALQEQLQFSPETLDIAMQRHASYFAYYATGQARADREVLRCDQYMDVVYAKADAEIREEAAESGEKITEAKIKERIQLSKKYVDAQRRLHDAQLVAALWKSAADAFRQRKDMLVQSAMNNREEGRGQTRLVETSRDPGLQDRARDLAAQQSAA